tara:strand:- start:5 stop:238 length:234 start_codon:yes stop_codon:yes gene_type:complete
MFSTKKGNAGTPRALSRTGEGTEDMNRYLAEVIREDADDTEAQISIPSRPWRVPIAGSQTPELSIIISKPGMRGPIE